MYLYIYKYLKRSNFYSHWSRWIDVGNDIQLPGSRGFFWDLNLEILTWSHLPQDKSSTAISWGFPYFVLRQNFSESWHCSDTKSSSSNNTLQVEDFATGLQTLLQEVAGDSCENTHIFILCDWLIMTEVFTKSPWVGKCQFLYRIHISSPIVSSHIWAFKK